MKRLKIFKAYFVLWLFVYFIAISNLETFKLYFLSTLTFNIAIVALLAIGTFMIFKAAKDLTMVTGTFGVLMYKRGDISFYLKGIEKVFPSNIAKKIEGRAKSGTMLFTQQESEDILSWLEEKYSNQNKYNNFFIGTVLMIGLLGTFAGLLGSIASMGSIVSSLAGDNVDIGKIMGDFAVPLSSMAVGFGSSLFGVISAILLSIKGYLLNKAQESLFLGVENWLQSKTVEKVSDDNKAGALTPATTLQNHQPSYMDIFLNQISTLSSELKEVSSVNREFQTHFIETMQELKQSSIHERELLFEMKNSLQEIAVNSEKNIAYHQDSQKLLADISNSSDNKLNHLINAQQQQQIVEKERKKEEDKKDILLNELFRKHDKKDTEYKMSIFHMAEFLENMDKKIDGRLSKLESISKEEKTAESDFMQNHLNPVSKV
jgi:hypothetical protein